MMLSNVGLVAFHYKSYGTFLILKKPYNSTVELPTTEIIEPDIWSSERARLIFKLRNRTLFCTRIIGFRISLSDKLLCER